MDTPHTALEADQNIFQQLNVLKIATLHGGHTNLSSALSELASLSSPEGRPPNSPKILDSTRSLERTALGPVVINDDISTAVKEQALEILRDHYSEIVVITYQTSAEQLAT
jgi:hypothetical protein